MDYIKLSKLLSQALRHSPDSYGLFLDKDGWCSVKELIKALQNNSEEYAGLTIEEVEKMILTSKKKRHEIVGDKIRAFYGHSVDGKIEKKVSIPPLILYHGTTKKGFDSIKKEGFLNSLARQYVHLSIDIDTAVLVASRKTNSPIVLEIQSKAAYGDGVRFYKEQDQWLSDDIPFKFMEIHKANKHLKGSL